MQDHAREYTAGHSGRAPFTDCWPWAEAFWSWSQANRLRPKGSLRNERMADRLTGGPGGAENRQHLTGIDE
ncbi:hypothetical protein [Streptomyces sp. HPF1205]|uniref:hypothetical protein n=1 Tax=Streptomyces sp. HPF1205 TaxID=2873262 RepID=UPI001CEDB32B|nr:hypothetical protein [Streptomyces sp. HPF1205]